MAGKDQQNSSDNGDFLWSSQGNVPAALNKWMENITVGDKDTFNSAVWLGSSSEYSDNNTRNWNVYSDGRVRCYWDTKRDGDDVRPVLAF